MVKKTKSFVLLIAAVILIFLTAVCVSAEHNNITVVLDGEQIAFDVQPTIISGRTMVPLRAIFEALGASVLWDEETQSVFAVKGDVFVILTVNSPVMLVNEEVITLDVAPTLVGGRTFVPVRAISEAFGCQVGWDGVFSEVSIINDSNKYKMLYAAGGRSRLFAVKSVNEQLEVGWYNNPELTDNTYLKIPQIIMSTNAYFKPYEYYDGEQIVGIDVDIASAIAEELGMELVINDMKFESVIEVVSEGYADFCMAGITATEFRLEQANCTINYYTNIQSIIVTEDSPIEYVDYLYADGACYRAGVKLGTTGDIYITADFGAENVVQFADEREAIAALLSSTIDYVVIDERLAKKLAEENNGIKILETSYCEESYVIYISKENTELLDSFNAIIEKLIADGTIESIVSKYIK